MIEQNGILSKWNPGYPQPEDDFTEDKYKDATYRISMECEECCRGVIQKGLFRVKKEPRWGSKHFFMLNWVPSELLVRSESARVLMNAGIKGFEVKDVIINSKNTVAEEVKQIFITEELEEGLIVNEGIKTVDVCPTCGNIQYIGSGRPKKFKKEIFENIEVDIIKTREVFGFGILNNRKIIISKKFYEVIKGNNMDRSLEIEPLMFD